MRSAKPTEIKLLIFWGSVENAYRPNLRKTYFGYELNLISTKIELKIVPYDICVPYNITAIF